MTEPPVTLPDQLRHAAQALMDEVESIHQRIADLRAATKTAEHELAVEQRAHVHQLQIENCELRTRAENAEAALAKMTHSRDASTASPPNGGPYHD